MYQLPSAKFAFGSFSLLTLYVSEIMGTILWRQHTFGRLENSLESRITILRGILEVWKITHENHLAAFSLSRSPLKASHPRENRITLLFHCPSLHLEPRFLLGGTQTKLQEFFSGSNTPIPALYQSKKYTLSLITVYQQ